MGTLFSLRFLQNFLVEFIGNCSQQLARVLDLSLDFVDSLGGQQCAPAVSAGYSEKIVNFFGERNVNDGNCQFNVAEMSWASYGCVSTGLASLSWLKGSQPTVHEPRGYGGSVFVIGVGGLYLCNRKPAHILWRKYPKVKFVYDLVNPFLY